MLMLLLLPSLWVGFYLIEKLRKKELAKSHLINTYAWVAIWVDCRTTSTKNMENLIFIYFLFLIWERNNNDPTASFIWKNLVFYYCVNFPFFTTPYTSVCIYTILYMHRTLHIWLPFTNWSILDNSYYFSSIYYYFLFMYSLFSHPGSWIIRIFLLFCYYI